MGGLPDQLAEDRLGSLGLGGDEVPLRRGRQRNSQAPLERLRPVERHAGSIFQKSNHAADGGVVLLLARRLGQLGGEDHATQMTAQLLQVIDLGADGSLTNQPHHHARTARVVDRARLALRARIARGQRGMRDLDLLGAYVIFGPVAAVASDGRLGIALGLAGATGCQQCCLTFRARRRLVSGKGTVDHRRGLLRLHAKEHLPQAADCRVLVADRLGQADVRLDQSADRLEIVRPQLLGIAGAFLSQPGLPFTRLRSAERIEPHFRRAWQPVWRTGLYDRDHVLVVPRPSAPRRQRGLLPSGGGPSRRPSTADRRRRADLRHGRLLPGSREVVGRRAARCQWRSGREDRAANEFASLMASC